MIPQQMAFLWHVKHIWEWRKAGLVFLFWVGLAVPKLCK